MVHAWPWSFPVTGCGGIASGLQAVGTGIELWALLGIVWGPWLRPKLVTAWLWVQRHLPFRRPRHHEVKLGDGAIVSDAALDVRAYKQGPADDPTASPEERIGLLVRRVGAIEERLGETEKRFEKELDEKWNAVLGEVRTGHQKLTEKVAEIESSTARIRVKDGVRFAVGVSVVLVGSVWGTFC
jgi:hypothetical protein